MEKSPIKTLIDRWETRRELASEIGVPVASVHKWAEAGRIPAKWQARVIRAAQAKGLHYVNGDWMVNVHEVVRGAA